MKLSYHDQNLLNQADASNAPSPAPYGKPGEDGWIGRLSVADWAIVLAAADARDELAFREGREV